MLCPNECYGMAACIDGTSNTMLVSEKSDYFYSQHTGKQHAGFRIRIDGSFANGGTGTHTGGWWLLGTNNGYTSSQGSTTWVPAYNVTTLRAYTVSRARRIRSIGFNGKNANINVGNNATATNRAARHRPDAAEQSADLGPSQRGARRIHGRPHAADHQEHAGPDRQAVGHPRRRPTSAQRNVAYSPLKSGCRAQTLSRSQAPAWERPNAGSGIRAPGSLFLPLSFPGSRLGTH